MAIKIEAAGAAFSPCADRFVAEGYRDGMCLEKQIEELSRIDGLTGIPFLYPLDFKNAGELKNLLRNCDKAVGTICPDTYMQRKWKNGTLASRDPAIRRETIKIIKESMDLCHEVNGADILLWFAHDGYDYPFEDNYSTRWNYLVEGLREAASYRPDVKLTIEYKAKEPRTHQYVSDAGKSLLLCQEVGCDNLGIVVDFGHSICAGENPAEAADLIARRRKLFHIHMNDNYRTWDDDLLVGSVHFWETLEFFYILNKAGYDGWYVIDIWPSRIDGIKALKESVKRIQAYVSLAAELPKDAIEQMQEKNMTMDIMSLLREYATKLL